MTGILGDPLLPWLRSAMDLSYQRQGLLNTNLANADTPGYVPRDLEFNDYLTQMLQSQSEGMPAGAEPTVEDRPGPETGFDGNQVNLDDEMMKMAANKLLYELVSQVSHRKMALIRYAIDEGGR
ncbi:MAG: flagellar basal body rod protein FlgB [Myxococcales bacterium]|nr:flagellar basal body rod protein FlgB [Myxococcales bacterium]|tara:strand:+ start:2605 stop:2976 length:372 start_codon:yes stop_codon:yes gene_type:complete